MVLQANQADCYRRQFDDLRSAKYKSSNAQVCLEEENVKVDYQKLLREKINEMDGKIKRDEIEESYQIGAGSFTQTQWNKLLSEFDDIQDNVRELMREEHTKREEKALEKEQLEKERLEKERLELELEHIDEVSV